MTASDLPPDLVVRIRGGDRRSFETLFRRLHGDLLRYARSLDPAEADDAVQTAFVTLWRRRQSLDPGRSVRALLYTTVRNTLYNHARDTRRRGELLDTMPATPSPTQPDDTTDAALLGARIREWLGELPERQQEAFSLSRFDGLSYAEIADVMDCSRKTVENHIGRALRTLRDRLRDAAPDALLS
ncbi:MAG: RNA polymerase sigma-70 factor [Bacteroidota bacterium]